MHRSSLIAISLVLAVAIAAVVRFATVGGGDAPPVTGPVAQTAEQVVATLERATAARPDDPRVWQQLGSAYVRRLVQTNDPAFADLARRALDRADALAPGTASTLVAQAALAATLHQFAHARDLALAAAAAAPAGADALVVLVDADVELGRYDDAATHLQQLLDRRPDMAALSRVAYLRELHGDVDGALAALRQAEVASSGATDFDRATVLAIRGETLFNAGRIDDAATSYDAALVRSPGHILATIGKARVLAARGDHTGATALLGPLVDRVPVPAAATLQGDVAKLDGRADYAAQAFELVRATARLQEASGADVDLESALFEADHGGDPASVLDLAERAYRARPSIHGADALAWVRYRAGDLAGAAKAIDEALRLGTRDASLLFHAAAIHARSGDDDRARRELRDAFAANPWFAIGNRAEVASLAGRLRVDTPAEWGAR